jgi:hypothetical protein
MPTNEELDAFYEDAFAKGNYPSSLYGIYMRETGNEANKAKAGINTAYVGPMQLGALAAKEIGVNRFDPYQNITGGLAYADKLLKRFGSPDKALAAYNWGPTALSAHLAKYGDNWFAKLPAQVQHYVMNVGARDPRFLEMGRRESMEYQMVPEPARAAPAAAQPPKDDTPVMHEPFLKALSDFESYMPSPKPRTY